MSDWMANDSLGLAEQFNKAEKAFVSLDASEIAQGSPEFQTLLHDCIRQLETVGQLVRAEGIFSPNESLADIDTQALRYILAPAYLGQLAAKLEDSDRRLENLTAAEGYIKIYLSQLKAIGCLGPEDTLSLDNQEPTDANEKRIFKIRRYQRDKELKAQLKALAERMAADTGKEDQDDSLEREHVLALLNTWTVRSSETLGLIRQERSMLEQMDKLKRSSGGKFPPVKQPAKAPMKPFTITRDMVKVFGRGYPSPYTMTVAQAASKEHDLGWHNHSHSEHSKTQPEGSESESENDTKAGYIASDAATYKQRRWDDFTDNNPRGIGNRHNKS